MPDTVPTDCTNSETRPTEFDQRGSMYRQYETNGWFWSLFVYTIRPDGTVRTCDPINILVSHARGGMERPRKINVETPDGSTVNDVFARGHLLPSIAGPYTFTIETPSGNESIIVEVLP
ncbi:MAG: hypothetical protein Q7S80_00770 [bacterium]|nr:hypothetical protein [bacterium]